jgi:hypothetical protein
MAYDGTCNDIVVERERRERESDSSETTVMTSCGVVLIEQAVSGNIYPVKPHVGLRKGVR